MAVAGQGRDRQQLAVGRPGHAGGSRLQGAYGQQAGAVLEVSLVSVSA